MTSRRVRTPRNARRGALLVWVALALVGLVAGGSVIWSNRSTTAGRRDFTLYEVEHQNLRISVLESGNLQAAESIDIYSEIRGSTTILNLIDEGTWVQAGDVLVELDVSKIEDDQTVQRIRFEQAYASWVQAVEAKAIQESQNQSNLSRADLTLSLARTDLTKYKQGDWPLQQEQTQADILLAKSDYQNKLNVWKDTQDLVERGFESDLTRQRDELEKERAEVNMTMAKRRKEIEDTYEYDRQMQILSSDVEEAEEELERVKRRAKADMAQVVADLNSKLATRDLEKDKLDRLDEQIGNAVVRAPAAGLVVYPTNSGGRHGGSNDRIEEGVSVRERQLLISLPDTSTMMVAVEVHESVVDLVKASQPAVVSVDAFPEETFLGRVTFVAPLPDSANQWLNPDLKVYRCEITLSGESEVLRPGMSASAEIMVEEIEDALAVPVHAVHREGGLFYCYVREDDGPVIRKVKIGVHNDQQVAIKSGLEEGELVYLAIPLDAPQPKFEDEGGASDGPSMEQLRRSVEHITAANQEPRPAAERGQGPGRGGRGGMSNMSEAERERWRNMSPEEKKKKMEEFMKNMTPEQRKQMEAARKRVSPGAGQ